MAADGNGMSEKCRAQRRKMSGMDGECRKTDGINSRVKSDVRAESEE